MLANYTLTVTGCNSLLEGIHKASVSDGCVELVFTKDGETILKASLAADRRSLSRSLQMTHEKIERICSRLGINESDLEYDRSPLSKADKLIYKLLFLKKMLFETFIPTQWVIVYKQAHETKWHKIIPDSALFQADPFVVFKDNKYYVFYEELKFEDYRGYLCAAELDIENNRLINDKVILDFDYHLSFPNVLLENGTYYMIPESEENNSVDLFECTSFPYEWKKKKTLIDKVGAVDTTPLKINDDWYLFTSEGQTTADYNDELSIYKSADLLNSPFQKLYDEPVITDVTKARMAGNFIQKNGELIRVSQDCAKRYGHQLQLNKVIQIENGYIEEPLETITPTQGAIGIHTYNQDHDLIIADMEIARFDIYSLKRFVGGNLRRIFEIIIDTVIRNKGS
ncbi:hypothetical protein OO007_09365 [Cocleimonas sp. KMM 6892]|uniref:glucosamine inositolphosphorylceramide transferase family protein n=1 Tax=unclassified Cocleimonas TaxID=2639732 RepID=UPI002DC00858|nr:MULTISPECIES: hypothetical protein [unclassified Cocleimonas]MEB8432430.1 hypothetical protein [Cocleimonas sp. KMM 6892]MEC4715289.1 hypothetical protein [Cocleimonas sp. KMM 6895]MEC4745092.1 hypothetical protein [Cocleimonas sp. KMM 6896]